MNLLSELKNLVGRGTAAPTPEPAVVDAPAAIPAPEPELEAAPVEVVSVPDAPVELDEHGEDFRRPANPEEEKRTDLPQRSQRRIAFLLATYEAGNIERTMARIAND